MFPGKGKTPVRRNNTIPTIVPTSAEQAMVTVLERSCEKSCQVTSEQIKADMKAAAEKKRYSSKEMSSRAGKSASSADVNVRTARDGDGPREAARPASTPLTVSVEGDEPCMGTSRQSTNSHRATTGSASSNAESSCKARTEGTLDREKGAVHRTAAADTDSLDCGSDNGKGFSASSEHASQQRSNSFVPRRPLTRSCTRLSSVPLLPETGKTKTRKN